jgi:hypothetical protein
MTEEELQNSMYNVECDLEKVDDDVSYLIEVLRYRTDEVSRIKEDLKEDRILYRGLDNVHFHLENCTETLEKILVVFRDRRSKTEEYTKICSRLVKGGIENNESK